MLNGRSTEPSLDELFGDIAMRLLMGRDGVTESYIRALLSKLKDARTVAGAHTPERTETALNNRASKSSEAGKNRLRFI